MGAVGTGENETAMEVIRSIDWKDLSVYHCNEIYQQHYRSISVICVEVLYNTTILDGEIYQNDKVKDSVDTYYSVVEVRQRESCEVKEGAYFDATLYVNSATFSVVCIPCPSHLGIITTSATATLTAAISVMHSTVLRQPSPIIPRGECAPWSMIFNGMQSMV